MSFRTDLLGFGVTLDKNLFFDRAAVKSATEKASKRFLASAGMKVRQAARRSMRSRKKASAPGQPPSAHRKDAQHPHGPLLKDRLFFQYEPFRESVVVGPEKLRGAKTLAPATMEHGGFARVMVRPKPVRSGRKASPKQKEAFLRKVKNGTLVRDKVERQEKFVPVAARPFMGPALRKEMPQFPNLYARSFGRSGAVATSA
jgi:hypothetical protein